jgi:hypothetical protein
MRASSCLRKSWSICRLQRFVDAWVATMASIKSKCSRVWIYALVAIVKKRLKLSPSLYEILQILSLTMFEREPLNQLLTKIPHEPNTVISANQLNLFD